MSEPSQPVEPPGEPVTVAAVVAVLRSIDEARPVVVCHPSEADALRKGVDALGLRLQPSLHVEPGTAYLIALPGPVLVDHLMALALPGSPWPLRDPLDVVRITGA